MFEYTQAEVGAQVANLPLVFRVWFQWMFAVIVLAPILFVRHRPGRVALLFSLVFIAVQIPLMRTVGLTNLLSLTHLAIWGPLIVYLCNGLRSQRIRRQSLLGVWAALASATAIVSLVFDVRDFGRWIAGERGIASPSPDPSIPWLWVFLIAASLAVAGWYSYGRPPSQRSPLSDSSSRVQRKEGRIPC
jgi:hypothetical protein